MPYLYALLLLLSPYAGSYPQLPPNVQTAHYVEVQSWEEAEIWELTAYVCEDDSCITASGVHAEVGMVAATGLPMGQWIEIGGMGVYQVKDRGLLTARQIDVFMTSRAEALQFGRQWRKVKMKTNG